MTLANNPLRVSFLGKEIVLCRYNYLKKVKQNHHPRINFAQEKVKADTPDYKPVEDSFKVAKSIFRQGFLLPLPNIVQPVMWTYAFDSLNISPEPDFIVLSDECKDYYHRMPLYEQAPGESSGTAAKTCHIVNPGNFS